MNYVLISYGLEVHFVEAEDWAVVDVKRELPEV